MGNCYDCLSPQEPDETPNPETRRQQQAEAAARRQKETEGKGIKDPERLKRQQQRKENAEKAAQERGFDQGQGGLKWAVG